MTLPNLFLPWTPVRRRAIGAMAAAQALLALALWTGSGSRTLPGPAEVGRAWLDLVQHQGLLAELGVSVRTSAVALVLSTVAALAVAALGTAPVFRPLARLSASLRFLGFAGLTYLFMLASGDAHALRVWVLSFGMFVFMVTALLAGIDALPREAVDHCRTLGMADWRITGELVLLGQADVVLDLMRQNAAVGWTLLTLVEGMTRNEGGIGAMLLNQNRYFLLAGVFAIQLTILGWGIAQDAALSWLRAALCPYAALGREGSPAMTGKPYVTGERLLTIENLGVRYDRPILAGVNGAIDNLRRDGVRQGQVVCLLGPSGIGKSQLFRCMAGLQRPDTGRVCLNGTGREVRPGEVGVVAQHYPLFNHRSVWGNLMLAARRRPEPGVDAKERCLALLESFGLADCAGRYPMALSGGQRQRVAIAQQLLCSRHFLLMDEPFSGLDPLAKSTVCETILHVSTQDELNTIVIVTHDIESAIRIADTLWVLGRERDASGAVVPGARIVQTWNLAEMGLAWDPDIESRPEFFVLATELKRRFATL